MLQRISLKQESIRIAVRLFCFWSNASNTYGVWTPWHDKRPGNIIPIEGEVYQAFIAVLKIIR